MEEDDLRPGRKKAVLGRVQHDRRGEASQPSRVGFPPVFAPGRGNHPADGNGAVPGHAEKIPEGKGRSFRVSGKGGFRWTADDVDVAELDEGTEDRLEFRLKGEGGQQPPDGQGTDHVGTVADIPHHHFRIHGQGLHDQADVFPLLLPDQPAEHQELRHRFRVDPVRRGRVQQMSVRQENDPVRSADIDCPADFLLGPEAAFPEKHALGKGRPGIFSVPCRELLFRLVVGDGDLHGEPAQSFDDEGKLRVHPHDDQGPRRKAAHGAEQGRPLPILPSPRRRRIEKGGVPAVFAQDDYPGIFRKRFIGEGNHSQLTVPVPVPHRDGLREGPGDVPPDHPPADGRADVMKLVPLRRHEFVENILRVGVEAHGRDQPAGEKEGVEEDSPVLRTEGAEEIGHMKAVPQVEIVQDDHRRPVGLPSLGPSPLPSVAQERLQGEEGPGDDGVVQPLGQLSVGRALPENDHRRGPVGRNAFQGILVLEAARPGDDPDVRFRHQGPAGGRRWRLPHHHHLHGVFPLGNTEGFKLVQDMGNALAPPEEENMAPLTDLPGVLHLAQPFHELADDDGDEDAVEQDDPDK
ncbi:hypothetical protein SDC9_44364 [bioreactor metagenome]|uniref:Uncharacterized protein n=1 Tax=bioreactor metagenome TaxID=1076179 RepID=A0A644W343_9ZZZZ